MMHEQLENFRSLTEELDTWRKSTFDKLLARRPAFEALTNAVNRIRSSPDSRVQIADIRATLISVVASLDEGQPVNLTDGNKGHISNPAVIREVFGLTAASKNASVSMREDLAAIATGRKMSRHTIRKDIRAYVEQFSQWILDCLEFLKGATRDTVIDNFIPRPRDLSWLHDTYRQLVISGGGMFLLWGMTGTGKTKLAYQFATEATSQHLTATIRIGVRGVYEEDIRRALRLEGYDTTGWSDGQAIAQLRSITRAFRNLRLIVLDNVSSQEDVSAILPNGCNVPVLMTTQENLKFSRPYNESVVRHQVSGLPRAAAIQHLVAETEMSTDDAARITDIVGGHPETIAHVVDYLQVASDALQPLLWDLSVDPSDVVAVLSELHDAPEGLVAMVKRLDQRVQKIRSR